MAKSKPSKKQDYTLPGIAAMVLLTLFVMFLGWRIANIINPPAAGEHVATIGSDEGRQYLVYRTYRVLSRSQTDQPNDDTVSFEFFRYPLDGTTTRGESIQRIERERLDDGVGTPWMRQVSADTLLFARRDTATDAAWIDVSGKVLRSTADESGDTIWNGLPSPDSSKIANYDWTNGRVAIVDTNGLRTEFDLGKDAGALVPIAWSWNSIDLYLKTVSEGDIPVAGLWRLNTAVGTAEEVVAVRELKLYDFDLDVSAGQLVGATYRCDGLDTCGLAPSALHVVDLATGQTTELYSDEVSAFGRPRLSSGAKQVAFTLTDASGTNSIWVADLDVAGHEQRVTSGLLLDWIPDGKRLAVDRDNEIQLVSVEDGTIVSVVRRSGQYQDKDFNGVDFIGIVGKK